jgi:hypothetical protein
MSDLATTIDTWLDAYGEPDESRRVDLIDQVWAPRAGSPIPRSPPAGTRRSTSWRLPR